MAQPLRRKCPQQSASVTPPYIRWIEVHIIGSIPNNVRIALISLVPSGMFDSIGRRAIIVSVAISGKAVVYSSTAIKHFAHRQIECLPNRVLPFHTSSVTYRFGF